MENRLKIFNCDDDKFREIVAESKTYNELFEKICGKTSNEYLCYKTELVRKINKLDLDVSHIKNTSIRVDLKSLLKENTNTRKNKCFKYYLYEKNLKEEKCEECGKPPEVRGKPLVLQLDHINGICTDNRLENLRILCPDCHSQTVTYCTGQNNKNKIRSRPLKEILKNDLKELKNPKKIIEKYGITFKTFRDWIKKYNLFYECMKENDEPIKKIEYNCSKCNTKITKKNKTGMCVWCKSKCPLKEQLLEDIKQLKSKVAIGKKYGVTDNTIKKWYRRYSILN